MTAWWPRWRWPARGATEQRLAECLLDFDLLDETWPKERGLFLALRDDGSPTIVEAEAGGSAQPIVHLRITERTKQ